MSLMSPCVVVVSRTGGPSDLGDLPVLLVGVSSGDSDVALNDLLCRTVPESLCFPSGVLSRGDVARAADSADFPVAAFWNLTISGNMHSMCGATHTARSP
jgi:hypothetical protein